MQLLTKHYFTLKRGEKKTALTLEYYGILPETITSHFKGDTGIL